MNKEKSIMENINNNVTKNELNELNEKIRKKIFHLEKDNYQKKTLTSSDMVKKIRKIVEEEVK